MTATCAGLGGAQRGQAVNQDWLLLVVCNLVRSIGLFEAKCHLFERSKSEASDQDKPFV